MLYALCGLSGSGKTTLLEAVLQQRPDLARLVTSTTRLPRPGEVPERAYHFSEKTVFLAAVAAGHLVCPIQYRGQWYATAVADLHACVQRDTLAVLRPDKLSCLAVYTPITAVYIEMVGQEVPVIGEERLIYQHKHACHHIVLNQPGHLEQVVAAFLTLVRGGQ